MFCDKCHRAVQVRTWRQETRKGWYATVACDCNEVTSDAGTEANAIQLAKGYYRTWTAYYGKTV